MALPSAMLLHTLLDRQFATVLVVLELLFLCLRLDPLCRTRGEILAALAVQVVKEPCDFFHCAALGFDAEKVGKGDEEDLEGNVAEVVFPC